MRTEVDDKEHKMWKTAGMTSEDTVQFVTVEGMALIG